MHLIVLEIRIKEFGSVRRSVRPFFMMVRFGSAEPKKRQFGRTLSVSSTGLEKHVVVDFLRSLFYLPKYYVS